MANPVVAVGRGIFNTYVGGSAILGGAIGFVHAMYDIGHYPHSLRPTTSAVSAFEFVFNLPSYITPPGGIRFWASMAMIPAAGMSMVVDGLTTGAGGILEGIGGAVSEAVNTKSASLTNENPYRPQNANYAQNLKSVTMDYDKA